MPLSTPVALLVFNRPALTELVFRAIAQAQPPTLLVVADGPRSTAEALKCQQARAVIHRVDWECQVLTNFADVNLGCRRRISSGLDWVFAQVPEAIILEDDCLPAPSFFPFCEALLERYRDDQRVMHISGTNFLKGQRTTGSGYYFSKYPMIWGWASWRRAWRHYDVGINSWPRHKRLILSSCDGPEERRLWGGIFDRAFKGEVDVWSYQWLYACWTQGGLSIVPESNLVSNLGFGGEATHTLEGNSPLAGLPVRDMWEIRHPEAVVRDHEADQYMFEQVLGGEYLKQRYRWKRLAGRPPRLMKAFLKKMMSHVAEFTARRAAQSRLRR